MFLPLSSGLVGRRQGRACEGGGEGLEPLGDGETRGTFRDEGPGTIGFEHLGVNSLGTNHSI